MPPALLAQCFIKAGSRYIVRSFERYRFTSKHDPSLVFQKEKAENSPMTFGKKIFSAILNYYETGVRHSKFTIL